MSIVAEQSRGKIANNHSDLCPAAFRLSVESTINTNHRLCFKYLVCFLRSVSVLRQPGSLLRHAGTRSTSAFAPFLHEQLLPFITRNVSLHRFSERPRSPRRGDKPKFSKPTIYASSVQRIVMRFIALTANPKVLRSPQGQTTSIVSFLNATNRLGTQTSVFQPRVSKPFRSVATKLVDDCHVLF